MSCKVHAMHDALVSSWLKGFVPNNIKLYNSVLALRWTLISCTAYVFYLSEAFRELFSYTICLGLLGRARLHVLIRLVLEPWLTMQKDAKFFSELIICHTLCIYSLKHVSKLQLLYAIITTISMKLLTWSECILNWLLEWELSKV